MYASTLLLFGLLATCISARPAATSPPFEVTRLKTHIVEGGNTTIEFTVHDPDPLTNATQKCTGAWKTGSNGYPQGSYEPCGNSSFAWNMASFTAFYDFTLNIEHIFTDPSVGQYPYNQITDFGKANVSEPSVWCEAMGGLGYCEQYLNNVIKAPIWATIAKRR